MGHLDKTDDIISIYEERLSELELQNCKLYEMINDFKWKVRAVLIVIIFYIVFFTNK